MTDASLAVGQHPASYIPPPMVKRKTYAHPTERMPLPKMDDKNFPTLGMKPSANSAQAPHMNFLSKVKGDDVKEEDALDIARKTMDQLIKEGWAIIKDGAVLHDGKPILPVAYETTNTSRAPLPYHPESVRRHMIYKKPSYSNLYEIDYDNMNGAVVPFFEEDDGESSV